MAKFSIEELKTKLAGIVTAAKLSNNTFNVTRDNVVNLLDKIGLIATVDTVFTIDKLARFDGQYLPYGKTIEDWYQDLLLVEDYDSTGAGALTPNDPTYRPVYYSYTLGRKKIKTTIRNNNIERAVNNAAELVSIVGTQAKRLDDSMAQYRYGVKREMLGKYIELIEEAVGQGSGTPTTFAPATAYSTINTLLKDNNTPTAYGLLVKAYAANAATDWDDAVEKGYIIVYDLIEEIAAPTDTTTSNAFIKQLKNDVEIASDVSEGHSLNGNTIGAVNGLVLILKQGVMSSMEVDSFAGAFNREDLAAPCDIVVVRDFGSADDDYFGVLLDARGFRLHNTYTATRDNANGDGDFLNIFRHTEDTAYISRNSFVRVYKKP